MEADKANECKDKSQVGSAYSKGKFRGVNGQQQQQCLRYKIEAKAKPISRTPNPSHGEGYQQP